MNCGWYRKGWYFRAGVSVGGHFVYNNTMFNSVDKNDIMVLNVQVMILIWFRCMNNLKNQ